MAEMWITMGPQHPMTHGLWTLKVKVDGETVVEESVKKAVDNILNEGVISDDMKDSLDGVDPWMANKMKQ